MKFAKLTTIVAASLLLVVPSAMAQQAGTSDTGTSNGQQGTPGQPSPSSSGGGSMKSGGSMSGSGMKSGGAMSGSDMKSGDMKSGGGSTRN